MRKSLIFRIGILVGIVFCIVIFMTIQVNKSCIDNINHNWLIKLPTPYKEIYSIDSGESFHGDGERYNILEYKNEEDINLFLKFKESKNKSMEIEVEKILNSLHVPSECMPNFNYDYRYYLRTKNYSSTIYLIFVPNIKRLYVIEEIY